MRVYIENDPLFYSEIKYIFSIFCQNKGIEFEVRSPKDEFRGDCVITKTKIIWCEGKTDRKNGKAISWDAFIDWANTQK